MYTFVLHERDAICLARVRLPPSDPILHDLFLTWGNHMAKDGNYELAAKWLVYFSLSTNYDLLILHSDLNINVSAENHKFEI